MAAFDLFLAVILEHTAGREEALGSDALQEPITWEGLKELIQVYQEKLEALEEESEANMMLNDYSTSEIVEEINFIKKLTINDRVNQTNAVLTCRW